jgi:hypothetical protein
LSDITEKVGEKISGEVEVSGYGMVTVRVE